MTTTLTYPERAAIQDHEADKERFERIKSLFDKFNSRGTDIEANITSAINLGREIGLELQGVAGAEQITFSFFTTHCAAALPFDYQAAQRFISIARKAPKMVTTMAEAAPVMEQVLFAAKLLEMPGRRTEQQSSHDSTPATFVFHTLATSWERIESRWNRDHEKWDDDARASVRKWIEWFEKKAAELKEKL